MTSPVALMANVAPPASTPANDSATRDTSPSSASDFSKPWRQAHQQLAQQRSQAASTPPERPSPGKAAHADGKAGKHARDKDDDHPASGPDASHDTAAMLALLGQSVPAQAAPASPATATATSAADDGDDATVGSAGTTGNASSATASNVALLGAIQAGAQAGSTTDATKAPDGLKDKALSLDTQGTADADAADDGSDAGATASSPGGQAQAIDAKLAQAWQSATTDTTHRQDDHSDPLDALHALANPTLAPATNPASTVAAPHALAMQSSAGTPAFAQELGQQVAWLGGQDIKQARIRLHPEDLGELDVKVSVQHGGSVDVSFMAQHPQAVHAVQQTLGQLDTMLAHHGLSLGQAMVGQGGRGGDAGHGGSSSGSSSNGDAGSEGGAELGAIVAPVVKAVGLLDMFA
ncbi:flagellar hook-length control protein FliK [Dyella sedimenti]|uniref:flagellar hook-length control protein FliK n=1 Tax=Dyella sedimenti TaxID=2919947 RepID=UPI001FAA8947|nr:flagellar hook-length control protein FliK [Dyella sedimenti]